MRREVQRATLIPYDPVKDFEPIIIEATSPEVLVVHPSVLARNVQELVALMRAGRYNNFAIAGVGTSPHLSTELFKLSLKLDIVAMAAGAGHSIVETTKLRKGMLSVQPERCRTA